MERYCNSFSGDVSTWPEIVKIVEQLPFECIHMLGHGEQCSVHTITPVDEEEGVEEDSAGSHSEHPSHWTEDYYDMNDVEGKMYESDTSDDSSDCCDEHDYSDETSSSDNEEWTNLEDDHDERASHVTIITPSPMGPVEVVAKRFSNLKEDVCYQACHPDSNAQLFLEANPHKYLEWLSGIDEHVTTKILNKRITSTTACYDGFISESLCNLLLTDLVARDITPHVTMAFRALQCRNSGYLIQERITATLEEVLESNPHLDATALASLYFQIVFTLHILQDTCELKHHDLHVDNVFLKEIDEEMMWKGEKLMNATHFSYKLGDSTIYLPNTGFIVKLGDFGMSSFDLYGRRVQRLDMETYSSGTGWGDWNSILEGIRGYDVQMLMGAPPFEKDSWRMEDEPTREFLRHMRRVVHGPNGKVSRSRLRPLPGHVSDIPPLQVLREVFTSEPGEKYDFRTAPEAGESVVVCLGDVADLSTEKPVVATPRKRKRRSRVKREDVAAAVASVDAEDPDTGEVKK